MRQNFASPHYSFQCFAHPRLERKTESSVPSIAVNLNRLCLKLSAVSIPFVVVVFFSTLYLKVHLPLIPLDDLFITNFFLSSPTVKFLKEDCERVYNKGFSLYLNYYQPIIASNTVIVVLRHLELFFCSFLDMPADRQT